MAEANRYLRPPYLPDHNRRFSREAASAEDYHRKRPSKAERDAAFRLEESRGISNDWVVQYRRRRLQIERESRYAPAAGLAAEPDRGSSGRCRAVSSPATRSAGANSSRPTAYFR